MPRLNARAIAGATLAAALLSLSAVQGAAAATPPEAVPGELIVRFESGLAADARADLRESVDARLGRSLLTPDTQVVKVDGSVVAAARELEAQAGVVYAEPNYVYRQAAAPPNDPRFGELWGLRNVGQAVNGGGAGVAGVDLNALRAWDSNRGAGQVVAIVDGGVALKHPDLAASIWTNPGEVPGNAADDDGNGYVDDVHGWDFVANDNSPEDHSTSHGTHVAGTVAAVAGNGIGIAGVAPQAKIMPVAGTGANGSGKSSALAEGIRYAARSGATVINGSFSGPGYSQTMSDAISFARDRGVVVVVAAGNDGVNVDASPRYPCAYQQPNLICVAALDRDGGRASYSNYGPVSVDVGAPGTSVLSAALNFDTLFSDGFDDTSEWSFAGPGNAWGLTDPGQPVVSGPTALTDSPKGSYLNGTDSIATMVSSLDLTGRTGCRVAFRLKSALEYQYDYLRVRAVSGAVEYLVDGGSLTGTTPGTAFSAQDLPLQADNLTPFAGSPSVRVRLNLQSDGSNVADGVYVDDLAVRCRSPLFDTTSYRFFNGTSMASPHVAGAVALLRAATPGVGPDQIAARIRSTTVPTAALNGLTTSGGRVDAGAAIFNPAPTPASGPPPAPVSAAPPPRAVVPKPCAGLKGARLAQCRLTREITRKCVMLRGTRRKTCAKKVRALATCRALPAKGRKAKAKRAKCIAKANKIGQRPKRKR